VFEKQKGEAVLLIKRKFLGLFLILFLPPFSSFSATSSCDGKSSPDKALAIAIDVSGSVRSYETVAQMKGYIAAFEDPQIQQNLLGCSCTEISVIVWSNEAQLAFGPRKIKSHRDISDLITLFEGWLKKGHYLHDEFEGLDPTTDIANALSFSGEHLLNLESKPHSLDISITGDSGIDERDRNLFERFMEAKKFLDYQGIVVNVIPIQIEEYIERTAFTYDKQNRHLYSPDQFSLNNEMISEPRQAEGFVEFYRDEVRSIPLGRFHLAEEYKDFPRALKAQMDELTCRPMM
jgi:hypothetical protein